jgi:hypothetical protein
MVLEEAWLDTWKRNPNEFYKRLALGKLSECFIEMLEHDDFEATDFSARVDEFIRDKGLSSEFKSFLMVYLVSERGMSLQDLRAS